MQSFTYSIILIFTETIYSLIQQRMKWRRNRRCRWTQCSKVFWFESLDADIVWLCSNCNVIFSVLDPHVLVWLVHEIILGNQHLNVQAFYKAVQLRFSGKTRHENDINPLEPMKMSFIGYSKFLRITLGFSWPRLTIDIHRFNLWLILNLIYVDSISYPADWNQCGSNNKYENIRYDVMGIRVRCKRM